MSKSVQESKEKVGNVDNFGVPSPVIIPNVSSTNFGFKASGLE